MVSFYSPVISASKTIENQEHVKVKINNCIYGSVKQNIKDLTVEEVKELKQVLLKYDKAIEENNFDQIAKCESWLKEEGILNEKQLRILSLLNRHQGSLTTTSNGNISGSNCIFSATGDGFMVFPIEVKTLEWIEEQAEKQENPIGGFVLVLLLIVLFYVPVMLATHLIPFRIAMPHAQVVLNSGTMKVGDQEVTPPVKVNLSFFTGITISTPKTSTDDESEEGSSGGFLFVKGYTGKVEEVEI